MEHDVGPTCGVTVHKPARGAFELVRYEDLSGQQRQSVERQIEACLSKCGGEATALCKLFALGQNTEREEW